MEHGGTVLLEPISAVSVHVPDEFQGDIIGDITKRRGRIIGMGTDEAEPVDDKTAILGAYANTAIVICEVPTSQMMEYATDLNAMTQGRGWVLHRACTL